jgi:hypothetical protein
MMRSDENNRLGNILHKTKEGHDRNKGVGNYEKA